MEKVDISRITEGNFAKMISLHYKHKLGDEHDFADNEHILCEVVEKDISQEKIIDYVLREAPRTEFEEKDNQCIISFFDHDNGIWHNDFVFDGTLEENKVKVIDGMIQSILDDDLEKLATQNTAFLILYVYDDVLEMNTTGYES